MAALRSTTFCNHESDCPRDRSLRSPSTLIATWLGLSALATRTHQLARSAFVQYIHSEFTRGWQVDSGNSSGIRDNTKTLSILALTDAAWFRITIRIHAL